MVIPSSFLKHLPFKITRESGTNFSRITQVKLYALNFDIRCVKMGSSSGHQRRLFMFPYKIWQEVKYLKYENLRKIRACTSEALYIIT